MRRQHDNGENCNRNGVPVEEADVAAHIEVGKKRHREIPLCIERHAARDVPAAAPKRIARRRLERTKLKSQYPCQSRSLMCPPTSIETPRRIRHHKIKKSAR